jgi:predicted nucleic acid-binding protein
MKVLLDTNVLLDVAQARVPHRAESEAVVTWCVEHPGQSFVAWHTLSNLYFIIGNDRTAREFIADLLKVCEVPATGTAAAKLGLRLPLRDYEDALQLAAALEAGADVIVTRDEKDFRDSTIPGQSPSAFLAALPR